MDSDVCDLIDAFSSRLQVVVVARLLEALVREVLDRLVVEERVERLGVGLRVLLVHGAPERGAPLGHGHREGDVEDERAEGDRREPAVELGREQDDDERDLDQRRQDVVDRVVQQRLDRARAALDVARDAAGLALEVKAQAQRQQVLERLERDAPGDPRRDRIEQEFAQLGEERDRDAQRAVGEQDRDRNDQRGARVVGLDRQGVDQSASGPAARRCWRTWRRPGKAARSAPASARPRRTAAAWRACASPNAAVASLAPTGGAGDGDERAAGRIGWSGGGVFGGRIGND